MPLTPGTHLGPYEILARIGAGGMGEVYRARDTKLNRDVAIKVLPELFAQDADRLARFTREAQTLAALNHPNIAQIYAVETTSGVISGSHRSEMTPDVASTALVMEFVDGEDLSAIIARGPLPLSDALPIARQIAEALEAAHEAGVIHRDLKPANIKVRSDGTVKVLDFGLAKAMEPAGPSNVNAANSPTLTAHGTAMGTLARMTLDGSPRRWLEDVRDADWSPDGVNLAIVHVIGSMDQLEYPVGTVLHRSSGYISDVRVAPDGAHVAFFEHPSRFDDRGLIKIADLSGRVSTLTREYAGIEGLAWSVDGRSLLFSAGEEDYLPLIVNVAGTPTVRAAFPSEGLDFVYDVAADGHVLVSKDTQRQPSARSCRARRPTANSRGSMALLKALSRPTDAGRWRSSPRRTSWCGIRPARGSPYRSTADRWSTIALAAGFPTVSRF